MKPFNLELAKKGYSIRTRDGRPVRIICFDRKDKNYPICALIDDGECEAFRFYTNDGRLDVDDQHNVDLFMAPVKREGWVNAFKTNDGVLYTGVEVYETKEDALKCNKHDELIDALKIEWEE